MKTKLLIGLLLISIVLLSGCSKTRIFGDISLSCSSFCSTEENYKIFNLTLENTNDGFIAKCDCIRGKAK